MSTVKKTFTNSETREEQLLEDFKDQMRMIEENSSPTKRWWHIFRKDSPIPFEIEGIRVLTTEESTERRAFLDGFEAGRKDGNPGPAYKLWRKMRDHQE